MNKDQQIRREEQQYDGIEKWIKNDVSFKTITFMFSMAILASLFFLFGFCSLVGRIEEIGITNFSLILGSIGFIMFFGFGTILLISKTIFRKLTILEEELKEIKKKN